MLTEQVVEIFAAKNVGWVCTVWCEDYLDLLFSLGGKGNGGQQDVSGRRKGFNLLPFLATQDAE